MKFTNLGSDTPWVQLEVENDDWLKAEPSLLLQMFAQMRIIREFESTMLQLAKDGLVHGPMHSSIGQEGGAVGSVLACAATDRINGTHRGHHQFLAKALQFIGEIDTSKPLTDECVSLLKRSYSEILGLRDGFSMGRGGSMHLQWVEAGAMGTNAIVGGGVPLAVGSAWDQKLTAADGAESTGITTTYFGDGASNIGSVLESLNLAAAWSLPVCFFIENNKYAVATHVEEVTRESRLSARGPGFGIKSWKVDGMNPLAVYLCTVEARKHLVSGHGPALIEADVYRYYHQSGPFPGSVFGYRTKQEEASWSKRDPLTQIIDWIVKREILSESEIQQFEDHTRTACRAILEELLAPADSRGLRSIRKELWPNPSNVDSHIRGDLSELASVTHEEHNPNNVSPEQIKFVDTIANSLAHILERDGRALLLGEDIHRLNGGTNGATKHLAQKFPGRVIGTPICENAFAGAAGGLAMCGTYRPIIEFMFADFLWVAADQIFNQIGRLRHMYGGNVASPLILRAKVGTGTGYGSQHSMDPAGLFSMASGWRIVAPSNPYDYVGLLNTAHLLDDPVLIIEQTELYNSGSSQDLGDMSHHLLPRRANLVREGTAATVITYLNMVQEAAMALDNSSVSADLIDLRWLDKDSLDWGLISRSVQKTGRVLIVEQGSSATSYGSWLSDEIQRRLFDYLDHPIERVTGGEAAPTISKVLERAAIARSSEIELALLTTVSPSHT